MADQKLNLRRPEEDYGETLLSWKFLEFPKHERNSSWYLWAGVGFGLLIIYSIWSANLLFGLIIVLFILTVVILQRNNTEIDFSIMEDGIKVGKKFYDYKDIENFYIIYEPPAVKTLYFEPRGILSPRIPVPMEDQNPSKVREILLQYLDEDDEKEDEPLSDQISRLFKF